MSGGINPPRRVLWRESGADSARAGAVQRELLAGQKLQGVLTSNEVQAVLRLRNWEADFPLFTTVNKIVNRELEPADVTHFLTAYRSHPADPSVSSEEDLLLPPLPTPVGTA